MTQGTEESAATEKPSTQPSEALLKELIECDIEGLVGRFVRLRDKIKGADDAHKERTALARATLSAMNSILVGKLTEMGAESCRTAAGTVYQSVKKSATTADGEAFLEFLISEGAWDLADVKPNAPAVKAFIDEHGAPPTGVNYSEAIVAGVRRS